MLLQKTFVRSATAAASAYAQPNSLVSAVETKVSRLSNGLITASLDLNGPVSSLIVAYRAGSRYQQVDEGGFVHMLRNLVGRDSPKYLGKQLLWQLGSVGGNLNSYATKDLLAVQLDVIRDNSLIGISLLGEFASPALKHWDIDDVQHSLRVDLDANQPYHIVQELIYKAAYRNGSLANSVLAQPFQTQFAHNKLDAFVRSRLVTGEAVILGVNVEHEDLFNYASEQGAINEGNATVAINSPYLGGDTLVEGDTTTAHVIIAGEGTGLKDFKSLAVQEVLSSLIGASAGLKFTNSAVGGAGAVVAAVVEKASNRRPVGVGSVNLVHADSGLVGVYLVSEGQYAEPIVRAAWNGLKSLAQNGPESTALTAAQKSAQLDVLLQLDQPGHLALDQAHYVLATGNVFDPSELAKLISTVTAEDIKKAAQKIVSKPSLAAYGKINQVPYVDEL